jgi:hypothetical protein
MVVYGPLKAQQKSGAEPITIEGSRTEMKVLDFWQWAHSDLISNSLRGVFAEYLVASAVGFAGKPREEWAAYDILSPEGVRIEVKSAAYMQSWFQSKPSAIRFTVSKRRYWDPTTNVLGADSERQSDVYVFALLAHPEKETLNPLELTQWDFYVLSRRVLDDNEVGQSITLKALEKLGAQKVKYQELRSAILTAAGKV